MSTELQIVERSPKNEVAFGQKAAQALMDIVREKRLARKFGGEKEHIYVEGWQILAQFAGLSAVTQDAEPIEIDGVKGAKASCELIRDSDGMVLGAAIAYTMRDEPNWKNKPWFQLASMAQTRAESKAIRMKLGWVAAMAGYSGTPAEEMEGVHPKESLESPKGKPQASKRSSHQEPLTRSGDEMMITADQETAIKDLCQEKGIGLRDVLLKGGVKQLSELTTERAKKCLAWLESLDLQDIPA